MKSFPIAIAAGALLLSVGTVSAAEMAEVQGTIRTVNPHAGSIVLENGKQFRLGEGVSLQGLKPGMKVSVTYIPKPGDSEDDGGGTFATKITPAVEKKGS